MDILKTISRIAGAPERFRDTGFSCGDCERNARCGQPPTAHCPTKLEAFERDPTGYERRMKARLEAMRRALWV
jgi:hypothetical protein